MVTIPDRASVATGVLAPLVALSTMIVGVAASSTIDWPTDPVSVVGRAGEPTALLFNAGLVAAGLLTLPFAARLREDLGTAVAVLYALVGASLAGAGAFPSGTGLHEPFGAGIFVFGWLTLWAAAVVDWRSGSSRAAAVAFLLGAVAIGIWLPYDFSVAWAMVGYGRAELVSMVAFALWSALTAARLRTAEASAVGATRAAAPDST